MRGFRQILQAQRTGVSGRVVLENRHRLESGRASRSEYWWFVLAEMIGAAVADFIHQYVYLIAALSLLLPALAAGARRLHDIGESGWMLLLGLVPIANFWLLHLLV